jgi:hypothetical protein
MDEEDELVLTVRAIAAVVAVLAGHMKTPEDLRKRAGVLNALAEQQEAADAAGVAIHPSRAELHDPRFYRAVAEIWLDAIPASEMAEHLDREKERAFL